MYRWVAESAESFCCSDFFLTTPCSDANRDGDNALSLEISVFVF